MAYFEVPMAAANVAAFEFSEPSESEIIMAVANLDASGSSICDGILPLMLKFYCRRITSILATLFNCSLRLCAYPATWKNGFITPVHKRRSIFDMCNYRPISILPIISRVFERILRKQCKQLSEYLEKRQFLSPQQHCFHQGRSCLSGRLQRVRYNNVLSDVFHIKIGALKAVCSSRSYIAFMLLICFIFSLPIVMSPAPTILRCLVKDAQWTKRELTYSHYWAS